MKDTAWVKWDASRAEDAVHEGGVEGAGDAAHDLLRIANERTPVDTGRLRESGAVDIDPATTEAVVSYNTEYAVIVHEDPGPHHEVGEAKWLQKTWDENPDLVRDAFVEALRRRFS